MKNLWDPSVGTSLKILREEEIVMWLTPLARGPHLYTQIILVKVILARPVITHMTKRCTTSDVKWIVCVDVLTVRCG